MTDWSSDLDAALASGNPAHMKAMLARVPKDVLHRAIPFLYQLAKVAEKDGKLEESLTYHDHLIEMLPGQVDRHAERAHVYLKLDRFADALVDAERIAALAPKSALGPRLLGQACEGLGESARALAAFRQVLDIEPGDEASKQRIGALQDAIHKQAVLRQTLDPDAAQESIQIEMPEPPKVVFDPALFDDPSIPASFDVSRVDGVRQHLRRYSGQASPRNTIARLEDPVWLAAWDAALAATSGSRLLFRGSELGVFALRALHHGAKHALCMEAFALDARIAGGMAQKHFLTRWHAQHGAAIEGLSEEERHASFDQFASGIDVGSLDSPPPGEEQCDYLVFPRIDHTLLGTGIIKAIRQYQQKSQLPLRVLPAKARVFAMAVQWAYPDPAFRLEPMNHLRWSLYPQALDLEAQFWTALTEPVRVGDIDFANFAETEWQVALPVINDGGVDAIIFWFELDMGNARISNAPGSELRCIKPAVQYADAFAVQCGGVVDLRVRVEETRLYFQTNPRAALPRAHRLSSWYVPMLGDLRRNQAYRGAIEKTLANHPAELVLDIGAGCGLLAMMAAQAGARQVIGCESHPAIFKAGKEVVALNGFDEKIVLLDKDCRDMKVPDDLPRRAELAVFELFDSSLIGEGILHFLAYARTHLLTENARYLPATAKIRAMVIEYRFDRIWDIDANLLNPYNASPAFINVDAAKLAYRPLTEVFDVFAFDFASAGPEPQEMQVQLPTITAGIAGAVLFWFDLGLDEGSAISNDPHGESQLHWKQGLQFLPEVRFDAGASQPLVAKHNGSALKFQWQQDALPKESLSKVPRFDPRWLAANSELEQQTQGLLQHCMQNPDEYTKVAEIAQRFAINPGAHDLDPNIAQRFASMFFGA